MLPIINKQQNALALASRVRIRGTQTYNMRAVLRLSAID